MPFGEEEPWDDVPVGPSEFSITPPASANVGANSPGPGLSSQAPAQPTEPQLATDESDRSDAGEPEPLPEFDPRFKQDFEGLLYLGKLYQSFNWVGHKFVIRTLTTGEILEVGLIHREYVGTISDLKAYQAALVAGCCEEVDGRPIAIPITDDDSDSMLLNRFRYIKDHWFPPTLDVIYDRYMKLEERVNAVLEAMGKAYGWTESTPTWKRISV